MAVTKFAQNGLVRLSYEMQGNGGKPVVLLHGLLQDRAAMRPLADELAEGSRVITMDLRGHGASSAIHGVDLTIAELVSDVIAVLDSAEVTDVVTVVGVELGAVVAQAFQQAFADRVKTVVLINYPTEAMLDTDTLTDIATRAYREQTEQAMNKWLDLSWGEGWKESVPKPRIASARRSAAAIHPMLSALADIELARPTESMKVPGGFPFANDSNVQAVIAEIASGGVTD